MARLIGPSLAGLVVAAAGEGICFLVNGISFVAVLVSLLRIHVRPGASLPRPGPWLEELRAGVSYIFDFVPIRAVLILLSVVNLMGMSFVVLMPVFAKQVLHGGPDTLGFLMAAIGLGALISALLLAYQSRVITLGRLLPFSAGLFACSLLGFAFTRVAWLSVALLAVVGFGFMAFTAMANTILQTLVEDDKRGRVMSFYTMSFMGMAPLGSLLAGGLAQALGTPQALGLGAVCCLVAATLFAHRIPQLKAKARPVYERLGIWPKAPNWQEEIR